ncbi:MAG: GNAT family N-acetyltransferase [Syntrophomonas sp.]
MTNDYVIRNMSRSDLDIAVDWAAAEGWNPGLNDAECFFRSDSRGFFIGEVAGIPIGSISAVSYDKHFGFIGFYIVKPECRSRGYGIQLWNRAMEYLRDRVVGLDGVVAQQENYQKSGFTTAYRNIRFEGIAGSKQGKPIQEIVELSKIPMADILSYEKRLFPASRPEFIKGWINPGDGAALGYIKGNRLLGYGVIRACRHGYKIGPLFADDDELAGAIFKELVGRIKPGTPFFFDVPELNTAAVALASQYGMQVVFETARMYRGQPPQLDLKRIYGVSSFELG